MKKEKINSEEIVKNLEKYYN